MLMNLSHGTLSRLRIWWLNANIVVNFLKQKNKNNKILSFTLELPILYSLAITLALNPLIRKINLKNAAFFDYTTTKKPTTKL